ncbi:MAG TPA: NADH-quinone oxidoreductase subunit C [Desulfomicrobiaceae bacterium]|nr:NADH-quinone oxidoreductase subunit C [Desulfomicrobiaceae bacterium]
MNNDIRTTLESMIADLSEPTGIRWTKDLHGNDYGWCTLARADDLPRIARDLQTAEGRLITITGHAPNTHSDKGFFEVSYNFVLRGVILNLTVIPEGTKPAVPSITRWHKAADWAERELAESYEITVTGHPDMRPLFLNAENRDDARARMVPLSVMTNSAVTSTLWERIMGEKTEGGEQQ